MQCAGLTFGPSILITQYTTWQLSLEQKMYLTGGVLLRGMRMYMNAKAAWSQNARPHLSKSEVLSPSRAENAVP